jgi:NDP-sugar pyrophosphorylase family protein
MAQEAVSAELYQGLWMDIGTMERLNAFDALLAESP